jgi:hypothetical protein
MNHYLGKGTTNNNGIGFDELEKSNLHTKTSAARLPTLTQDRGMFNPSPKQIKAANLGPGAYTDRTKEAFIDKSFKVKPGSFGTAVRDTHFSKYSSQHKQLIAKGIY